MPASEYRPDLKVHCIANTPCLCKHWYTLTDAEVTQVGGDRNDVRGFFVELQVLNSLQCPLCKKEPVFANLDVLHTTKPMASTSQMLSEY